jgi:hypothetical protein
MSRCVAARGRVSHWSSMFALPYSTALEPATAVLPSDLVVCALGDDTDVERAAQDIILAKYPARPTKSVKLQAKCWRLFLTLWQRRQPVPRAFVNDVLLVALGLRVEIAGYKKRLRVAHVAGTATVPLDKAFLSLGRRRSWQLYSEPEVAGVAEAVKADAEALHHLEHPVADPQRVAAQVIASIREKGYVSVDDREAVWLAADATMLSRLPVSETMVVALALVVGVIAPDTGEPSPPHLAHLYGTQAPGQFAKWAQADATTKSRTGRWQEHRNGDGTPVRSVERWRGSISYRRMVHPQGPHCK